MGKSRKARRYRLSQLCENESRINYYIDINLSDTVFKAVLADISMLGIGFEIKTLNEDLLDKLAKKDYSIEINTPNLSLSSRAKTAWSVVIEENDREILKGGMAFMEQSAGEKNRLIELIKYIGDRG